MKCEFCSESHEGSYGAGRFCSSLCARRYSSNLKREEVNQKVSKKLKERKHEMTPARKKQLKKLNGSRKEFWNQKFQRSSWDELGPGWRRRRVLEEQKSQCALCKIGEWCGKPLSLHLDHINGDRFDNSRENVRMICPNCHSQTETYCSRNIKRDKCRIDDEQIIVALKENEMNISKTLSHLRLAYGGINWYRLKTLSNFVKNTPA